MLRLAQLGLISMAVTTESVLAMRVNTSTRGMKTSQA